MQGLLMQVENLTRHSDGAFDAFGEIFYGHE